MTETQRAAMQQALEALEHYVENKRPIHRKHEIIAGLRAALAQPEPVESTEPIWQTLAEIGESAPAGTWDAPVGPPASPSLTPAQEHADELLDALKALLHDPTGCAFCDSGTLRIRVLTGELCQHDEQCGFVKARAAIARAEGQK